MSASVEESTVETESATEESSSKQAEDENETEDGSGIGVAFSGGGIRSAAFSSGVLRKLLQKKIAIDYMSCVSGGGYTGTSYLEWKYRYHGKDDPQWHEKYFNHMRRNASSQCNWRNPFKGFCDSLVVINLLLFVGIVIPVLIWVPIAFPAAYLIDYFFGPTLRMGFTCKDEAAFNTTRMNITTGLFRVLPNDPRECFPDRDKDTETLTIFFCILLLATVLSYCLYRIVSIHLQHYFSTTTSILAVVLAFLFLPWFLEMYVSVIPIWMKAVILALGVILWMGIPPLRNKASWTLLVYFYSYVIKFKVFRNPVLGLRYNETHFIIILWIASILFLLTPFMSFVQQSCIHSFYRCRLQKSFYTSMSSGCLGCRGISCADFFPLSGLYARGVRPGLYEEILPDDNFEKETLTLKDLEKIQPQYICNVLVDNWVYTVSNKPADSFTLLTLSPTLIERIDDDDVKDFDEYSITPNDISLSDAMATSGAVVSYHMGGYRNEVVLSLQVMLGLTMGKSWIADKTLLKTSFWQVLVPFMIQGILAMPLLLLPIFELQWTEPGLHGHVLLGIFIGFLVVIIWVALMPTGKSRTSRAERFVRWCIVNIYQVRYLREILTINNVGEVPPAILYLSDGGHVENLGLLALLKRRMRKIIVTDGGFVQSLDDVGFDLLHSLQMARAKLRCSFSGMDGRDIEEDIRDKLVEPLYQKYTRHYQFKVQYYEKDEETNLSRKVGEGEVMLLLPRHPSVGTIREEDNSWAEYEADTGIQMKRRRWGDGPILVEEEVNRLTCTCSECCHCNCCQSCSRPICGNFPHHVTANQFFTPAVFSAYHREGFRAAMDASIENFVKDR